MALFRKKPMVIEAITFDELVAHGRATGQIVDAMPWSFSYKGHPITHETDTCYLIPTLEGVMKFTPDDVLITGVQGEIYPCKRDIFEATYTAVDVRNDTRNLLFVREITTHHDGFGLAEKLHILADAPGPGGASHKYDVWYDTSEGSSILVASITYQTGPRDVEGSTPGLLDGVLLAIVADRMEAFNAGPFKSRENALVLTHVQDAMNWLWRRAFDRAKRGVLGTMKT